MNNVDMLTIEPGAGAVYDRWSVNANSVPSIDSGLSVDNWNIKCYNGGATTVASPTSVTIFRKGKTASTLIDTIIDDTPRTISIALGSSPLFAAHSRVDRYNVIFAKYQICDGQCKTGKCFGPEVYQCTECADPDHVAVFEYGFANTATLAGRSPFDPSLTPPTVSKCILRRPEFWNKIDITQFNKAVYYGFRWDGLNDPLPDYRRPPLATVPPKYIYF